LSGKWNGMQDVATNVLMYFILPLWLAAGFADYLCHRAAHIECNAGVKESLIHLLMFAEMAVPTLAAIFLEINALVIAVMIASFVLHEATALWDVSYATQARGIGPIEQHVHSFLEIVPLMGLTIIVVLNWQQFLALFGLGAEDARFELAFKPDPLPWPYVTTILAAILLFEVLPYLEEFIRTLRVGRARPGSRSSEKSMLPSRR
jgi:hypothetical protein